MERRRIVLTELPPILAGLVREILSSEPDLELVVDELPDVTDEIDLVITAYDGDHLPEPCRRFIERRAGTKVLAIERDACRAVLYELLVRRAAIGELSPQTLVAAIH